MEPLWARTLKNISNTFQFHDFRPCLCFHRTHHSTYIHIPRERGRPILSIQPQDVFETRPPNESAQVSGVPTRRYIIFRASHRTDRKIFLSDIHGNLRAPWSILRISFVVSFHCVENNTSGETLKDCGSQLRLSSSSSSFLIQQSFPNIFMVFIISFVSLHSQTFDIPSTQKFYGNVLPPNFSFFHFIQSFLHHTNIRTWHFDYERSLQKSK